MIFSNFQKAKKKEHLNHLLKNLCKEHHISVYKVEKLLKAGADINFVDKDHYDSFNCFHYAVESGNMALCRLLISYDVDLNKMTKSGETALSLSLEYKHDDITNLLISAGVSLTNQSTNNSGLLIKAIEGMPNLNLIQKLIQFGADVNHLQKHSEVSPLQKAIKYFYYFKYQNINQFLSILYNMLQKGANINHQDKQGQSCLHYAASLKELYLTLFLIEQGIKINLLDNNGINAIHLAVAYENWSVVDLLELNHCYLDQVDKKNWFSFLKAAHLQNYNALTFYLEKEIDINITDKNGDNALHKICSSNISLNDKKSFIEFVQLLVENGINYNLKNHDGLTPLDLCSVDKKAILYQYISKYQILKDLELK